MSKDDEYKIAYIRLPKVIKEFMDVCQKDYTIVGFDWEEDDPWNFGIIIKDKDGRKTEKPDKKGRHN